MFLTKPYNIDSSLLETAKQSQNSATRMFDTNNVSARSYMSYQAFLPAVYLQNYFNAIKVNKRETPCATDYLRIFTSIFPV